MSIDRDPDFQELMGRREQASEHEIAATFEVAADRILLNGQQSIRRDGTLCAVSKIFEKSELDSAGWRKWPRGRMEYYEVDDPANPQEPLTKVSLILEYSVLPDDDKQPLIALCKEFEMTRRLNVGELTANYWANVAFYLLDQASGEVITLESTSPEERAEQIAIGAMLRIEVEGEDAQGDGVFNRATAEAIRKLTRRI